MLKLLRKALYEKAMKSFCQELTLRKLSQKAPSKKSQKALEKLLQKAPSESSLKKLPHLKTFIRKLPQKNPQKALRKLTQKAFSESSQEAPSESSLRKLPQKASQKAHPLKKLLQKTLSKSYNESFSLQNHTISKVSTLSNKILTFFQPPPIPSQEPTQHEFFHNIQSYTILNNKVKSNVSKYTMFVIQLYEIFN